ncbi:MAG: hypothetical protein K0B02_02555 [DPANN group archaeon]|nr:hypothetical protein [DPANN group archaeon]
MRTSIELAMIKNELRNEGFSTKGILLQEFRDMNMDDQKKWHNIKTKVRLRIDELEKLFPYAFGTYRKEQYAQEYITQLISR